MYVSQGYKPQVARDVLNVSQETFRYWRENIDPKTARSHFSPSDLLVYRILKAYTMDHGISIKRLKNFDWSKLFTEFNRQSYPKLKNLVVVLNQREGFLKLMTSEEAAHYSHYSNLKVDLKTIIEENIMALLGKGENPNKRILSLNDFIFLETE